MSIIHINKRAKRLSRLLPTHISSHENPAALSACQELVARIDGYSSYHAAQAREPGLNPDTDNDNQVDQSPGEVVATEKDGDSGRIAKTIPWDLVDEPYCPLTDSHKAYSGFVSYGPPNESPRFKGRYWVADIGYEIGANRRFTAVVFEPTDATSDGVSGGYLLHQDDETRQRVAEMAFRAVRANGFSISTPRLFVLVVRNGTGVSALCFDFDKVHEYQKGVVIEEGDFLPVHTQLSTLGTLRPYERFVLREGLRCSREGGISADQNVVVVRAPKYTFRSMLTLMRGMENTVRQQRSFGLDVTLTETSWVWEAMADVQSFDRVMSTVLANVDTPHLRDHTVVVRRANYVPSPGVVGKGLAKVKNLLNP